MNKLENALSMAALMAAVLIPAGSIAALTVTKVSQATRPNSATYGAEQISGVTYAGGDLYYAVDDNDVKLYPLTLAIDRSSGELASEGITVGAGVAMAGAHDMEGCAFDPASGKVWISQETHALIREFDPATGELTRSAPVPAVQEQYQGNYSLEALTISGDGRTMWTANEEALKVDGPLATNSVGSVVRLTRFTRASVRGNWTPDGEWAYVTQPIGTAKDEHTRSGVSGLCALPDGTLLVLERRCYQGGLFPDFNIRLYQVDFAGATDVSGIAALKGAAYTATTKTLLWQYTHANNMPNYEGICLGPRLNDGSCVLVLISDGGSYAEEGVITLKLSGLDVRTLYVEGAENSEPTGGPYRHVDGLTVSASLPGAGSPYEPFLQVHPTWSAPANNAQGEGSSATFAILADDTLRWSFPTNLTLPMLGADSFERIAAGTEAPDIPGWSGEGSVAARSYTPAQPPGYPLQLESHTMVLEVDGDAVRDYSSQPGAGTMVDTMLCVTRENEESPVEDVACHVAVFFDVDGHPTLQHRSADGATRLRTTLSSRAFANGDWVRASLVFAPGASGVTWCQVRIDGEPCVTSAGVRSPANPLPPGSWYRTAGGGVVSDRVSSILLRGTGAIDDLAVSDASSAAAGFEFDTSARSTTNGVAFAWLADNGLSWDTSFDLDGDGYDSRAEYAAGTDPLDGVHFLRIVDTGFDGEGHFQLRFLGNAEPSAYSVYSKSSLASGAEGWAIISGATVSDGHGTNTWTQAALPDGASRFFRVRIPLPED